MNSVKWKFGTPTKEEYEKENTVLILGSDDKMSPPLTKEYHNDCMVQVYNKFDEDWNDTIVDNEFPCWYAFVTIEPPKVTVYEKIVPENPNIMLEAWVPKGKSISEVLGLTFPIVMYRTGITEERYE